MQASVVSVKASVVCMQASVVSIKASVSIKESVVSKQQYCQCKSKCCQHKTIKCWQQTSKCCRLRSTQVLTAGVCCHYCLDITVHEGWIILDSVYHECQRNNYTSCNAFTYIFLCSAIQNNIMKFTNIYIYTILSSITQILLF